MPMPKIASILVPLDPEAGAEPALSLAEGLARRLGARLELVAVPPLYHYQSVSYLPYPGGRAAPRDIAPPQDLLKDSRKASEAFLAGLAEGARARGFEVGWRVLDEQPVEAILHRARDLDAGLILLSTHAREGLPRLALGSVADKLLQSCDRPMLLLRQGDTGRELDLSRILVALDGSATAERILPAVRILAAGAEGGARITLAHVFEPLADLPLRFGDTAIEANARYRSAVEEGLDRLAGDLRAEGFDATIELMESEDVALALAERIGLGDVGLLALTSHGRGGLGRWAFGSLADRLVRNSSLPLLILRTSESEATR
jgi:nucleotide-binding universal stress UspA family protein